MLQPERTDRWRVDGKFFRVGGDRVRVEAVTYGPFPGGWPVGMEEDFARIAAAGFNAIRVFEMPAAGLLDRAWRCGLRVFGGLKWGQHADFIGRTGLYEAAGVALEQALRQTAGHPALAGVYVANEVPADLVRWMGPLRVRHALEGLIARGRAVAPEVMFGYANFPSTEYLEPTHADFTAFNIYLEQPEAFRGYLRRLHHIAGDRPLMVSEFGLDSRRNGLQRQAATLAWAVDIAREEETAGLTIYAWSDRWWNAAAEVLDWDFGLTDRAGRGKPALAGLLDRRRLPVARDGLWSVIICTRNGRGRIGRCLQAVAGLTGMELETVVVDDGSQDGTADWVAAEFPWVRLVRLAPCGLSAARNAGAAAARGVRLAFTDDDCEPDREWLVRLARVFDGGRFAAVGGPNLAPAAQCWQQAVVSAAPGAPSHVMVDDVEAEHLPGCNLAVTRAAFEAVGGFDPVFHTAGDDVDFCWRLRAAGFLLGFAPGAFVWHWRRSSLAGFVRQQIGYGRAERRLMAKHPDQFTADGAARWQGFIYGGGPVRVMEDSIIYHGWLGTAGYQAVTNRMLPLRELAPRFQTWYARLALAGMSWLVPVLRAWVRNGRLPRRWWRRCGGCARPRGGPVPTGEFAMEGERTELLRRLLARGWQAGGLSESWDVERGGTRVLLAGEEGEDGHKHTLVRVWGAVGEVTTALAQEKNP